MLRFTKHGFSYRQLRGLNLIRKFTVSDSNRPGTLTAVGSPDQEAGKNVASEAPVLPRVANGDPTAVAECLNRYKNLVWSLARRSCPDVESAEDAVQDIFLKLWTIADRFNAEIASESTFVAMIARRRLIDISRKKSWKAAADVEMDAFSDSGMGVSQQAELKDEAARAARLLEELPVDQQRVIRLSIYEGLSHSLIAEATGLSLGTVKTHIRRGMLKLRQALFACDDEVSLNSFAQGESQ